MFYDLPQSLVIRKNLIAIFISSKKSDIPLLCYKVYVLKEEEIDSVCVATKGLISRR